MPGCRTRPADANERMDADIRYCRTHQRLWDECLEQDARDACDAKDLALSVANAKVEELSDLLTRIVLYPNGPVHPLSHEVTRLLDLPNSYSQARREYEARQRVHAKVQVPVDSSQV